MKRNATPSVAQIFPTGSVQAVALVIRATKRQTFDLLQCPWNL